MLSPVSPNTTLPGVLLAAAPSERNIGLYLRQYPTAASRYATATFFPYSGTRSSHRPPPHLFELSSFSRVRSCRYHCAWLMTVGSSSLGSRMSSTCEVSHSRDFSRL